MEQKKKEYSTPKMKEVKLNSQIVLLGASNDPFNKGEVGLGSEPGDIDRLA